MHWTELTDEGQLIEIQELSKYQPVVIFKHSTRCNISAMAKGRLERATPPAKTTFYHLDLVRHRQISNAIAAMFEVKHESPQVLIIRNGECVYDESHNGISMEEIEESVQNLDFQD